MSWMEWISEKEKVGGREEKVWKREGGCQHVEDIHLSGWERSSPKDWATPEAESEGDSWASVRRKRKQGVDHKLKYAIWKWGTSSVWSGRDEKKIRNQRAEGWEED